MTKRDTILIAGATASGKSTKALELAQRHDGVIVNADSMQVYDGLRVLTARPSPEEEACVPHKLYGHVAPERSYSVAQWLEDVRDEISAAHDAGRVAIIVGGTGLYFKALLEGLSPVPPIPGEVRQRWRQFAADQGSEGAAQALHAALAARDPEMAARLSPTDTQRLTRALEVIEGTGRSLAYWQSIPGEAVIGPDDCQRLLIRRPRDELHARADARLEAMIAAGALEEVRGLIERSLPADLPVMRALGVAPLAAHVLGRAGLGEALERAKAETRQYIKRQETWARRNMNAWNEVFL